MKIRNIISSVVAGASLLTMVGTASAAITGDINIYGASAQFNFWKAQAVNYMGAQGCTSIQSSKTTDGKNAISRATCGGVTRYFRTSSKASYDGPLAIQGNTTNPNRTTLCGDAHQRMMMDEAQVTSWGTGTNATTMPNTALKCVTVNGGASDVQVTSFQQESHGMLLGPSTSSSNVFTDRNFKGTGAVAATGLTDCRDLVVPFSFYINNGVTMNNGANQVTNLTTAQARLIFSGQIADWSDLGFDAKPMYACWRHAGSGTAATIDLAVMRPAVLQTQEDTGNGYSFYFNDGSADEMACINGDSGGVGYADADQSLSSYPNVHQATYNGVAPSKATITAGLYDFYSVQNLYTATPVPSDMATLCTFMKNPANNTNAFYATSCEMKYVRGGDQLYNTVNPNLGICN
ncbi:MAG TPA: substrate-binding domain-containing protein [Nitrospirota bacterium]|nr:substrate-binding domain-containing protein [Nitrospirota bacterium]